MTNCSNLYVSENSLISEGYGILGLVLGIIIGFIISFLFLWICYYHRKFISIHYRPLCLSRIHWTKAEVCFRDKGIGSVLCARRRKAAVEAEEESSTSRRHSSTSTHSPSPSRRRPQTASAEAEGDEKPSSAGLVGFCLRVAGGDGSEATPTSMIDVITQTTEYAGEQQLCEQDCSATEQLEQELTRQRLSAFAQLCWLLLNSLAKEQLLDSEASARLQTEQLRRLQRLRQQLDEERRRRRREIETDPRLDGERRAAELDRLASGYSQRLAERLGSELDRLARDAGRQSKLDEEQLDELLQRLKAAAARLEEKLQRHRLRRSNSLEEQLARRRLLLAEQKAADEELQFDVELRLQSRRPQLQRLQADGAVADWQRVFNGYRMQLLKHKEAFERDYLAQQQTLAERLRHLRRKQEEEAEQHYSKAAARLAEAVEAGTMTDAEGFLEQHFLLLDEFAAKRQQLAEQQDDKECNQLSLLRDDLAQEKRNAESATEEQLRKQVPIDEEDWGRLLDQHRNHTEKLRRRRRQQHQQQLQQLEEKLSRRQSQLSDSLASREAELLSMEKSQELVLHKTLAFQLDMDEAAKRRIMEEHHRGMLALGNSLQVSRLKQEKRLEAKVAARKSRIGELRRKCRDAELAASDERQAEKARNDLQRQEEEQRRLLEAESRAGRQRLRDELAKETEEALRWQESQLSGAIAKLQTGKARRRRIIDEQDRILSELQSQLEAKVAGEVSNPSELDQILHSHRNQVASLSEQMQRERRQQEQQLAERLQRRQMEKEEEVKDSVDQEERTASKALSESGHGQVARFALELSLDAKFRNSMMQMEEEMRLELKRQQEELDREMEADLQSALEDQRKQLLSQLARVTNISESEMKRMVARAGESSGAGRKLTRQVSTDITEAGRQLGQDEFGSGSRRTNRRGGRRYEVDTY